MIAIVLMSMKHFYLQVIKFEERLFMNVSLEDCE